MGTLSVKPHEISKGLMRAFASAVFEWVLIFMMLINGAFSYIITKCACRWKLHTPCIACSRLDHVLGSEKKGYQWGLLCQNHKSEISSLVLCHAHNKLADVHGMCESCLFSFATINKSNAETYRLLVGKLGEDPSPLAAKHDEDPSSDYDGDPLLGSPNVGFPTMRNCSCCNRPWVESGKAQKLLKSKAMGSDADLDAPMSSSAGNQNIDVKGHQDKALSLDRAVHLKAGRRDPLAHVGYTELKITSDSESEVVSSDDDEVAPTREANYSERHLTVQEVQKEPHIHSVSDDLASQKLIDTAPIPESAVSESQTQFDDIQLVGNSIIESTAIGHGLEELNWHQAQSNDNGPAQNDLISLDDLPPTAKGSSTEVLEKTLCNGACPEGILRGGGGGTERGEDFGAGTKPVATPEAGSDANHGSSNANQVVTNPLDLGDAYKLALSSKGRQLSGRLLEQWIGKDSPRFSGELKQLLSQISAAHSVDQSLNDMSPRLSGNTEELKTLDASNAAGTQILQKRISLERNESGLESLDGSIISEIEGESVVDRLKRQIEHDKKIMSSLYKELEEERSASAVSANQAMAMITRLQGEKAALHMEALQCVRMMEEQTEYDNEALQKANDLLTDKEKEMQDLEAELEFYRHKYPNDSMLENPEENNDMKARDIGVVHSESSRIEDSANVQTNVVSGKPYIFERIDVDGDMDILNDSLLETEDEKVYITRSLEKLEKMLHFFSNNGVTLSLEKVECGGNGRDEIDVSNDCNCKEGSQHDNELEVDERDADVPMADSHIKGQISSLGDTEFSDANSNLGSGKGAPLCGKTTDLISLENEISDLQGRLEALEADREFLEHSINSFRYGETGLHFIRQIAYNLQELRRIGIRRDGNAHESSM